MVSASSSGYSFRVSSLQINLPVFFLSGMAKVHDTPSVFKIITIFSGGLFELMFLGNT